MTRRIGSTHKRPSLVSFRFVVASVRVTLRRHRTISGAAVGRTCECMDNDEITPTIKRYKQNDNQTTISYNAIDYNSPQQSYAKYLMATSNDSSQSLTRTNPFKLAKAINEKNLRKNKQCYHFVQWLSAT